MLSLAKIMQPPLRVFTPYLIFQTLDSKCSLMDPPDRSLQNILSLLIIHIWTSNCSDCICPVFVLFAAKIFALPLSNSHQPNLSESCFMYFSPFANKNQGQVWPKLVCRQNVFVVIVDSTSATLAFCCCFFMLFCLFAAKMFALSLSISHRPPWR